MLAAAIDMATPEGATEFDFLKGAERIKYVWPVRERATIDADVFSETSGAQFTRATRATRDAAAALSKSARRTLPGVSEPADASRVRFMGQIRPFVEGDIPRVARLHRTVFRTGDRADARKS